MSDVPVHMIEVEVIHPIRHAYGDFEPGEKIQINRAKWEKCKKAGSRYYPFGGWDLPMDGLRECGGS